MSADILVVGAGVFGLTSALSLMKRGYRVELIEAGEIPNPLAASTDISKAVRMEYGADAMYMEMVESAIVGWRKWNRMFEDVLYHEVGVTMLSQVPMTSGGFEYDSYQLLLKRNHQPERLDADEICRRFPAWRPGQYVDGFYHAVGGYAESGRTIEALSRQAIKAGITIHQGKVVAIEEQGGKVVGVRMQNGDTLYSNQILVTCGAWSQELVPALQPLMKATGHPVFHLRVDDESLFTPPNFTVFTADVARSGWYGFPLHPRKNVVKIANHGVGMTLHPENDARIVTSEDEASLRAFLVTTFPALQNALIVYTRRCLYSDTKDEHFLIDEHPEVSGLYVAAGGSGHGFKFAPILGDLVVDRITGRPNPWLNRFAWRSFDEDTKGQEAARHHGN